MTSLSLTPRRWFAPLLATATFLLVACSTPDSRIEKNYSAFSSWPEEVQRKVRAGEIDLGFTAPQVRMALGEPDRIFDRRTAEGDSEVWAYRAKKPRVSVGLGFGVSSGGGWGTHTHTSTAIGIRSSDWRDDDAMHVVLRDGRVIAIETGGR